MARSSVVVFTFEGLSTAPLGPYGCSWLDTPGIDRLAASSIIFDRYYACSTDPHIVLRKCLSIDHSPTTLAKLASLLGMPTLFFTDSAAAIELPEVQDFDQCTLVQASESQDLADDFEDTSLGRLLAAAFTNRESLGDTPHLLWVHSAALVQQWDAPLDFRSSDDLDLDVLDDQESDAGAALRQALYAIKPPSIELTDSHDPDLLIAWMAAYAAQVRLIDTLLEVVVQAFADQPETTVVLTSTGGFALGENGYVGAAQQPPKSSRLHLPMIFRSPTGLPLRCGKPVLSDRFSIALADVIREAESPSQDSLLEQTLPRNWAEPQESTEPILEIIDDVGVPESHVTTYRIAPGWFYVANPGGDEELYLKPDDRHDVNDVAKLSEDIVDQFRNWAN